MIDIKIFLKRRQRNCVESIKENNDAVRTYVVAVDTNCDTRKIGVIMLLWIVLGIVGYLLIGVGLLIWSVKSDPWGGLILEIWWFFILFYPFLIFRSLFYKFFK